MGKKGRKHFSDIGLGTTREVLYCFDLEDVVEHLTFEGRKVQIYRLRREKGARKHFRVVEIDRVGSFTELKHIREGGGKCGRRIAIISSQAPWKAAAQNRN